MWVRFEVDATDALALRCDLLGIYSFFLMIEGAGLGVIQGAILSVGLRYDTGVGLEVIKGVKLRVWG